MLEQHMMLCVGQKLVKRVDLAILFWNHRPWFTRISSKMAHLLRGQHRCSRLSQAAQTAHLLIQVASVRNGRVAGTDFKKNGAGTRSSEVGWRDIPPMWTVPSQTLRGLNA